MLIRSARASDLNQLLQLSAALPPGMTSMPFDKSTWEKKLAVVEESLMDSPNPDVERVYLPVIAIILVVKMGFRRVPQQSVCAII